jgi:hypothetical protein
MPSRTRLDKLNALHSSTVIFRPDRRLNVNLLPKLFGDYLAISQTGLSRKNAQLGSTRRLSLHGVRLRMMVQSTAYVLSFVAEVSMPIGLSRDIQETSPL